jgi:TPR repeat protein
MFERGRGVAQSYTKAIRWFRKAAEQGHTEAQFYMGYTISTDTDEDDAAAMRWLRKAAEQGHVDAQYHLDEMLEKCSKETQN